MKSLLLTSALVLPLAAGAAFAAGGGNETAPSKPKCKIGQVYDKNSKTCVSSSNSGLDADALYENLRELAHAERYEDAKLVIAQMPENDDRALTYLGFINRKMGDFDKAMVYYERALEVNPANILARSYMGQGFITQDKLPEAIEQLRAIWEYDGRGTWAEVSLRNAIDTGETYSY
ncbi:MAG: tetratricopeptide repeat protein [Pseudomonadota bacterium]